jgi:hypothetical protein
VLAYRIDELAEWIVGAGPVLRPLLPELAADDNIGDRTDDLAHQLALLGPEGVQLPQVRALDDAVDRAEQMGSDVAAHQ